MILSDAWVQINETQNHKILILNFLSKDCNLPSREDFLNFIKNLSIDKDNFLTQVFWAIKSLDNLTTQQKNFLESKKRYYLYQYYFTPWALTWEEKEELEEIFFPQNKISQNTSQFQNSVSNLLI